MYSEDSARYYDLIYSGKDYAGEVEQLVSFIHSYNHTSGIDLLDVACGTGRHIEFLKKYFNIEGIDISDNQLRYAAERNPEVPFHLGDMISFDLKRRFDVVTCLFSSIGYVKTLENLQMAVKRMAKHVLPGGLFEPWFASEDWHPNTVHALFVNEPELKLVRMNTARQEGRLSYFDFHFLIGTPQETIHFVEHHELGLFERSEMTDALKSAELNVFYEPEGLIGRGLYIGRKG
jgi:SAM-dependent methyltransferase